MAATAEASRDVKRSIETDSDVKASLAVDLRSVVDHVTAAVKSCLLQEWGKCDEARVDGVVHLEVASEAVVERAVARLLSNVAEVQDGPTVLLGVQFGGDVVRPRDHGVFLGSVEDLLDVR